MGRLANPSFTLAKTDNSGDRRLALGITFSTAKRSGDCEIVIIREIPAAQA
jgi:hypothetical protein